MKKIKKNIVSSASGTTLMTLFSYILSFVEQEKFSEPEHLGTLMHRLSPSMSKKNAQLIGWSAHYLVGFLFVAIYRELWTSGAIKKTVASGISLGLITGLFGAMVWNYTLKKHPAPPSINFARYLLQLVPAHIVFAVCATLTDRLLGNLRPLSRLPKRTDS